MCFSPCLAAGTFWCRLLWSFHHTQLALSWISTTPILFSPQVLQRNLHDKALSIALFCIFGAIFPLFIKLKMQMTSQLLTYYGKKPPNPTFPNFLCPALNKYSVSRGVVFPLPFLFRMSSTILKPVEFLKILWSVSGGPWKEPVATEWSCCVTFQSFISCDSRIKSSQSLNLPIC